MTITVIHSAYLLQPTTSIKLSALLQVTADGKNPPYLVVNVVDRNDYSAGASGATGSLSGGGHSLSLTTFDGDFRTAGLLFTYDAASNRYFNSTYGYLDQMVYHPSSSVGDFTELTFYSVPNPGYAAVAAYPQLINYPQLLQPLGNVGLVTSPALLAGPGSQIRAFAQATPSQIAAVAQTFVGKEWNRDGCWVLAETIATEAGAALPMSSSFGYVPGVSEGEWTVAFDGPAGQTGDWRSMVRAGDMVAFVNANGQSGHITTCVSGSGATAKLVDNAAFLGSSGQVSNPGASGSAQDITIVKPFSASLEWAQAAGSSVVIYRLDTPVVAVVSAPAQLHQNTACNLTTLFSISDPAQQPIIDVQVYNDTASGDYLIDATHGVSASSHKLTYLSVAALSDIVLETGKSSTHDTLEVRAENAKGYWGDWQSLAVTVSGSVSAATATVNHQYDLLSQAMAALPLAAGGPGSTTSLQEPPQDRAPLIAVHA